MQWAGEQIMSSRNLLVCVLARSVWEKHGQRWDRQLGTREPQSCCFCCHWEVWAHLLTATAARGCPTKPNPPAPQLQQPAWLSTDKSGCHNRFAAPRSCWFCPFLQPALLALLAASAAPEFGPSCTALLGNNQWRKTRWKGSILEAFSQKTKDTVRSTNSWSRMQPRQPRTSTTGICLFACPAQVTPAHAEYPELSLGSLAFPWTDNSGKDFRVGVWTHAPVMSCWTCSLLTADAQQHNGAFE